VTPRQPEVGGRDRDRIGSGGLPERFRPRLIAVALVLLLTACAREASYAVQPYAPGFLLGLWHGFIFPVAWVVSLFSSKVAIYAVPNNGGWYDFGYFLGVVVFGVGARKSTTIYRDRVVYRDRGPVIDATAKRVDE
jgi:hypothetical protein